MPREMKICKVCGKEYEACHTPNPGIFRWRDVACSMDCAQKYVHDVQVARGEIVEDKAEPKPEMQVEAAEPIEAPTEEEHVNEPADEAQSFDYAPAYNTLYTPARHGKNRKK